MSKNFNFQINHKGHLITRESFDLEYKESFHLGDNLIKYLRTMVGMANNRGGKIIFGVKNSPRIPIGLKNQKFQEFDTKNINHYVLEYFSHDFEWSMRTLEYNGLEFGQITIKEHITKPIICRKSSNDILREGAIYYRYRGETKEIRFPELKIILDNERKKERLLWMQHIEKIAEIGPQNVHFFDTYKGEIHLGKEKVLIDESLLNKIKIIKEGQLVEKDGAPTLSLVGEITGILTNENILPANKAYPYQAGDIKTRFNLNNHEVQALLWKMSAKGNPKYHDSVKTGQTSITHKYSETFMSDITKTLEDDANYIATAVSEYKFEQKSKKSETIDTPTLF